MSTTSKTGAIAETVERLIAIAKPHCTRVKVGHIELEFRPEPPPSKDAITPEALLEALTEKTGGQPMTEDEWLMYSVEQTQDDNITATAPEG